MLWLHPCLFLFSHLSFDFTLASKDHVGAGRGKTHRLVRKQDCRIGGEQIIVRKQDCKIGGEQNFVGVGGVQNSVGAGVREDGGKESKLGGMLAICSHINMHRLLFEDKRCMLSGVHQR